MANSRAVMDAEQIEFATRRDALTAAKQSRRYRMYGVFSLYLLALGWCLLPFLLDPSGRAARLIAEVGIQEGVIAASPLIDVVIGQGKYREWLIRWDALFACAALGLVLVTVFIAREKHAEARFLEDAVQRRRDPRLESLKPDSVSLEEIVWSDAVRADRSARGMHEDANLMLLGGLVMCALGLAIFYVSIPAASNPLAAPKVLTGAEWMRAGRALAMLLFVETIAVYMLKQHRALMEDFKDLYGLSLRRANYLLALKLGKADAETRKQLMSALLKENFSRRLGKDQSTEALEVLKAAARENNGAVRSLLEAATGKLGRINFPFDVVNAPASEQKPKNEMAG